MEIVFSFLKRYLEKIKDEKILTGLTSKLLSDVEIETSYLPSKSTDPSKDSNKIYITLLNIEEERNVKAPYVYKKEKGSDNPSQFGLYNPEMSLNLYIMISSTGDYGQALKNIAHVIEIFAHKNAFNANDFIGEEKLRIHELWLDIQNLSLDQSNNLWQALANHVLPHIIYKVRTISIIPDWKIGKNKTEIRTLEFETEQL